MNNIREKTHVHITPLQNVLVLKEPYFQNQRVYKILWSDVHRTYIQTYKDISYDVSCAACLYIKYFMSNLPQFYINIGLQNTV